MAEEELSQAEKAAKYDEIVAYLKEQGEYPISWWVELGKRYQQLRRVVAELTHY